MFRKNKQLQLIFIDKTVDIARCDIFNETALEEK